MPLQLSITNILHLISIVSPLLIAFFLIMSSLFNQDIKGIIYLMGVLIAIIINVFIMNLIKQPKDENQALSCNIFNIPYISEFNSPSPSSVFIAFSMIYLLLPMVTNGNLNYPVLIFFLCILGVDSYTKAIKKCTTISGILFGIVVGLILGVGWYALISAAGYDSLLYFDELKSNRTLCSRPSKQTFKCQVYKNGEPIGAT